MNNITNPFSFPIFTKKIPNKIFKDLQSYTLDIVEKNISNFVLKWDCPTLSYDINDNYLKSFLKPNIEEYYKSWEFINHIPKLNIKELWINLSKKDSFQEVHRHPNSDFSGVIYIQSNKDSGNLNLVNPMETEINLLPKTKTYSDLYLIPPLEGLLVIFPSWLSHYVSKNKSPQNRISISFNIKIN